MFYTKKEKRKLKNELKKELLAELERILKKDDDTEDLARSSYDYSYHENDRRVLEEACKRIIGLQNEIEKLSRRVRKMEQISSSEKSDNKTNITMSRTSDIVINSASNTATNEGISDDSSCTKFNKYINTGSMHSDFKSINLSYEVDMFSEADSGTALYYIVHLYDNEYELYPNRRFVDRRACQRAEMAFDFDIQGTEKIYVNKPCRLRKLMYGYAVEEKGKVSIL